MRLHADLSSELAELCRRLAGRCDYLELRVEQSRSQDFTVVDGEVESINRRFERGGNARALVAGAWGFSTFNSLDDAEAMAEAAISQAHLVGGGPVRLAPVEPVVARPPAGLAEPGAVPLAEKVAHVRSLVRQIKASHPSITAASGFYADRRVDVWLATSDGVDLHQRRLDCTCGLNATAVADGQVQRHSKSAGGSADCDQVLAQLDQAAAEEVATTAVALTRASKPEAGLYTVVVDPQLAGVFAHEAIGHLSEADHVSENPRLQEVMEVGRPLGVRGLDIYDTGVVAGSRGHTEYDQEGVPGERTDLVRDGHLVGRLHSRETAGLMGERPTGNARAIGYRVPPIVRMRTTCIGPGKATAAEVFSGIRRGIYCVGSMGGQTNMEMFTFSAQFGRLIEDGQPGELLRDVTLTGNTFQTLDQVEAIGADQRQVESGGGCGKGGQSPLPVGFAAPHLRIREVRIGGR